jgi:hypothetical protein
MPLSEYERQVLDELEHDLAGEHGSSRRGGRGRAVARCAGGVLSLLLILVGLRMADGAGMFVAVVGCALTVVVTDSAVTAARRRPHSRPDHPQPGGTGS